MVRLTIHEAVPDWARSPSFAAVVAAAFGQRRKTLRNALGGLLDAAQISALGIDPGERAESLSPVQFGALARAAAGGIR
jgi:16S rRNA (adenine1518-N6/adenine1519-N6)-dimethyltransferase